MASLRLRNEDVIQPKQLKSESSCALEDELWQKLEFQSRYVVCVLLKFLFNYCFNIELIALKRSPPLHPYQCDGAVKGRARMKFYKLNWCFFRVCRGCGMPQRMKWINLKGRNISLSACLPCKWAVDINGEFLSRAEWLTQIALTDLMILWIFHIRKGSPSRLLPCGRRIVRLWDDARDAEHLFPMSILCWLIRGPN